MLHHEYLTNMPTSWVEKNNIKTGAISNICVIQVSDTVYTVTFKTYWNIYSISGNVTIYTLF